MRNTRPELPKNEPARPGWDSQAPGWIVTSVEAAWTSGRGPNVLCPILEGLGPELSDIAATLPVGDANGLLLDALGRSPVGPHVVAGVLANDPFRPRSRLLPALRDHGAGAVANWPSLGMISGELAAALTHSGFTFEAEIGMLRQARGIGLVSVAFVSNAKQAEQAMAAEPDMLIVAPPLSAATVEEQRAAAKEAVSLFQVLKSRASAMEVRLYETGRLAEMLADAASNEGEIIRLGSSKA